VVGKENLSTTEEKRIRFHLCGLAKKKEDRVSISHWGGGRRKKKKKNQREGDSRKKKGETRILYIWIKEKKGRPLGGSKFGPRGKKRERHNELSLPCKKKWKKKGKK